MIVILLTEPPFRLNNTIGEQNKSVAIEILPTHDVIYKIADDLNFENWNFGFIVKGLELTTVDRLEINHYAAQVRIHRVEYSAKALVQYVRNQEDREITFHNFHFRLPEALSADSLQIELFSKSKSLGQKSVKLMRYKQRNQYRLPVSGNWFVSAGNDFGVEHRRHLSRGHFAWDFVRVNGKGHVSSGARLEDNFSYGQPAFAPAAGVVVDLHKGEPDHTPGAGGGKRANYVEIDHGDGEISRAVHLKNGSIQVSKGDSVKAGQRIGRVGNSGNSDGPHLHFGFQRNIPDGEGGFKQIPIPIQFSNYRVSWNQGIDTPVSKGRPRRGQFIRQD